MRFTVPGEPKAKGRPRFSAKSGTVYTPKETTSWENKVGLYAFQAGARPVEGAVEVRAQFFYEWPKSKHRKREPRLAERMAGGRDDIDNLAKCLLDGLQGVAFHNDRQVAVLHAEKWRALQGHPARTHVEVRAL